MKASFETYAVPLRVYVDLLMDSEKVKNQYEQDGYWIRIFGKEFYGTRYELREKLTDFLKDFDWSEA